MRDTSITAYNKIFPELGFRQFEVFKAISYLQYATNTMIAKYLSVPINCVTGRCKELRDKGLVEKSHTSWDPLTKNRATYWKVTED